MKKVGIVGAGISGLVLASLLKQNGNYQISIFEKDKIDYQSTNGIQISPNAIRILKKLNFDFFDPNKFCSIKGVFFYDCISNKKIGMMNMEYLESNTYITLNRNDLIFFLINHFSLKDNLIEHEVVKINNKSIFLKDNTKIDFDVLIVADGIFSKLRSENYKPVYSGYSAFRGTFKGNYQENYINLWMGKNFHLVTYPIDKTRTNSFTLVKKTSKKIDIADYNFVVKNFSNNFVNVLPKSAHEILSCKNVKLWPIFKLDNINYGLNEACFIGDSAHGFIPSRAQGAAQAIEDSFITYKLIIENNFSAKNLSEIRKNRVVKIIKKSENNLIIFHQNLFLIRIIRNLIIKFLCSFELFVKKINSFIFDYDFEKKL